MKSEIECEGEEPLAKMSYYYNDMDQCGDMDWWPENDYWQQSQCMPRNQCYDACSPAYTTMGCCTNEDLCEEIGIDQEPKIGKDGFQVWLDVANFKPEEITVDTENNVIVVHAKQEESTDGQGYMSREFVRRYELPEQFKPEDVVASLSCDGISSTYSLFALI